MCSEKAVKLKLPIQFWFQGLLLALRFPSLKELLETGAITYGLLLEIISRIYLIQFRM